jgi:hypothetical protein
LISSFYFFHSFRLSLPTHSALRQMPVTVTLSLIGIELKTIVFLLSYLAEKTVCCIDFQKSQAFDGQINNLSQTILLCVV